MTILATDCLSAESGVDGEGNRTYGVTWAIWTDVATVGPIAVRNALGLTYSSYYQFYDEQDLGAFFDGVDVQGINLDQSGRLRRYATVKYTTRPKKRCDEAQIDNPLLQPEKRSGSFAQFQTPLVKDIFGAAYTNAAGHPLFDAVKDDSRPSLVIQKNFPLSHLPVLWSYRDAVNIDTFYGKPKRQWKVMRIAWDEVFLGTCASYAAVTLEFQHDPDMWDFEHVNAGFYELTAGGIQVIKDREGLPVSEPHPLTLGGRMLPPNIDAAGNPIPNGPNQVNYVSCRGYPEKAFKAIGIRMGL